MSNFLDLSNRFIPYYFTPESYQCIYLHNILIFYEINGIPASWDAVFQKNQWPKLHDDYHVHDLYLSAIKLISFINTWAILNTMLEQSYPFNYECSLWRVLIMTLRQSILFLVCKHHKILFQGKGKVIWVRTPFSAPRGTHHLFTGDRFISEASLSRLLPSRIYLTW